MFAQKYNDISAIAFEGRKEEAKNAYIEELDRCNKALNGQKDKTP